MISKLAHRTFEDVRRLTLDDVGALVRVADAAVILDVSEASVRALIKAGTLDSRRVGRLVRIPKAAIVAWLTPKTETR